MPKVVDRERVYSSRKYRVIRGTEVFEDGERHGIEYIEHDDFVSIVPFDDEGNVYLVKEWRPAHEKYILQVPAGRCRYKDEKGRLKQAHDELREETGMDAKSLEYLYSCGVMAHVTTRAFFYLARGLFGSPKESDAGEKIEVVKLSFKDAIKLFEESREETLAYSYLALLLAKERLNL